jgi:hypothetical protein
MKHLLIPVIILLSFGACNHETVAPAARRVEFTLYTNENFASDEHLITFHLIIQDQSKTLLDSALAPMKVKDIPDFTHKIVIQKTVPGNNRSTLKVGFTYEIENVGMSWYYDEYKAGEQFKAVEFSFK